MDLLWVGPPWRENGLVKTVDEVVDGPADIIVEPCPPWDFGRRERAFNTSQMRLAAVAGKQEFTRGKVLSWAPAFAGETRMSAPPTLSFLRRGLLKKFRISENANRNALPFIRRGSPPVAAHEGFSTLPQAGI